MSLTYNGTEIPEILGKIKYNGTNLTSVRCDDTVVWRGNEITELIPTMTSSDYPRGRALHGNTFGSARHAWKAFDGNTTTGWLSANTTSGVGESASSLDSKECYHFNATTGTLVESQLSSTLFYLNTSLTYSFFEEVAINRITYLPCADEISNCQNAYDCTLYFMFFDSDGNRISTVSYDISAPNNDRSVLWNTIDLSFPFIKGVREIIVKYSTRMCNGSSNKDAYYCTCVSMQAYGYVMNEQPLEYSNMLLGNDLTLSYKSQNSDNIAQYALEHYLTSKYNCTAFTSDAGAADHYLQIDCKHSFNLKYIVFVGLGNSASYTNTYSTTIYADIIDSNGNIITTLSKYIHDAWYNSKIKIESSTLIQNVSSIKIRFEGKMFNGKNTTGNKYISCCLIEAFGTRSNSIIIPKNITASSQASSQTPATKSFDYDTKSMWLSQSISTIRDNVENEWLMYEFSNNVSVCHIDFKFITDDDYTTLVKRIYNDILWDQCYLTNSGGGGTAYVYADLIDSNGTIITTVNTLMSGWMGLYGTNIFLDSPVHNVRYIKLRCGEIQGCVRRGNSSSNALYYQTGCSELRVYS